MEWNVEVHRKEGNPQIDLEAYGEQGVEVGWKDIWRDVNDGF